jgi:4-hydroxy-tetrahydrodipicolinate synthase
MLVTALVTPFRGEGATLDDTLFAQLVAFQLGHGADRVLVGAVDGEGSSLDEGERARLLDAALQAARPEQVMCALGAGRPAELVSRGRQALERGVRDLLLVDAPYVGCGSADLRERWHRPVARALPECRLYPAAAPLRTGTELLPDDLARLRDDCPNVVGVEDGTGRLARMRRVRELCGDEFTILCADDALLRDAMIDPHIRVDGGSSLLANLAPAGLRALHDASAALDAVAARMLHDGLFPLFGLASVTAEEPVELGGERHFVPQRSRGAVTIKTALAALGVLAPVWRAPLGPMGAAGAARVGSVLRQVGRGSPALLAPLATAFGLDLAARLAAAAAPAFAGRAS